MLRWGGSVLVGRRIEPRSDAKVLGVVQQGGEVAPGASPPARQHPPKVRPPRSGATMTTFGGSAIGDRPAAGTGQARTRRRRNLPATGCCKVGDTEECGKKPGAVARKGAWRILLLSKRGPPRAA